MSTLEQILHLAPLLVVSAGACVVLLLAVAGRSQDGAHIPAVAILSMAVAGIALARQSGSTSLFSGAVVVDGLATLFGLTALLGAGLTVALAVGFLREHEQAIGEFCALATLGAAGMLVVVCAGDLMSVFVGIEIMSIAAYVLAGYRRDSRQSQEAALKYFIYGSFASGFVLFGIALLYGEMGRLTGTPGVGLGTLREAYASAGALSATGASAVALVVAGLSFKVAAVPAHMWAPDVYEGAPTPSSALLAVGIKAAAFAALCRFVVATCAGPDLRLGATQAIAVLAVATMFLGNLMAVLQTQIKRMLAYSSIAHAGYVLVAVAALVRAPSAATVAAIAYYLLGYTLMTVGAFAVVVAVERRASRTLDLSIDSLRGLGPAQPALGICMAVFMFSLAGVPPAAGFFGKLGLFSAAIEADLTGVVIAAVLASAIGAYYYLRVLVAMYMQADTTDRWVSQSPWVRAVLAGCAVATVLLGVLPEGYLQFARTALSGWH
jgi:NADH-quinone oxidoreductase subunit N